jgi:hypothetical protein
MARWLEGNTVYGSTMNRKAELLEAEMHGGQFMGLFSAASVYHYVE